MYSTIEETGVPYEISAKRSWDYSSDDKFTMGAQLGRLEHIFIVSGGKIMGSQMDTFYG